MRGKAKDGLVLGFLCLMACEGESTVQQPQEEPKVILDGGGEIPVPPNGELACPVGACNYQSGAGCAGQTCAPALMANDAVVPQCQPAGNAASGAACALSSECQPGYACAAGSCRKLCCGGDWTGCASENEHCFRPVVYKGSTGNVINTGAMLCYPIGICDPLVPASCTEVGTTCQIVDPTGAVSCLPEGTGASGQPCPCKGGFLCVEGACRRLCKAVEGGGEPSCQLGEGVCVHFNRDPPGVGECTL